MKLVFDIKRTVVDRTIKMDLACAHVNGAELIEEVSKVLVFAQERSLKPVKIYVPLSVYESMVALGSHDILADKLRRKKLTLEERELDRDMPRIKTHDEIECETGDKAEFTVTRFMGFEVEVVSMLKSISLGFDDWRHAFIFQKLCDEAAVPVDLPEDLERPMRE